MKAMGKGGMQAGIKTKEAQGTFRMLSQEIENNNTYRCWFPVVKTSGTEDENGVFIPNETMELSDTFDIQAVYLPGYKMDLDMMKTTFYAPDDYEELETGKTFDRGPCATYSRISRILYDARYKRDCEAKELQITADANTMGTTVNPVTLNDALIALKESYYGVKKNGINVPPNQALAIQPFKICMYTAGILTRLDKDLRPDENSDQKGFCMELNGPKTTQLVAAMTKALIERKEKLTALKLKIADGKELTEEEKNYKHCLDRGFIEVEYAYNGATKQLAGKSAAFNYCGEASDSTEYKFKEFWKKHKDSILPRLIYDVDTLMAKNNTLARSATLDKVRAAFFEYCSKEAILSAYVDLEEDAVKRSAEDILSLNVFNVNKAFTEGLQAIVEEKANGTTKEDLTEEETATDDAVKGVMKAISGGRASLEEVLNAAGGEAGLDAATAAFDEIGTV